jgi:multiple sugar transport system permease protein
MVASDMRARDGFSSLSWSNWPLAVVVAVIVTAVAVWLLPAAAAFWVGLGAACLTALSAAAYAYRRRLNGALLVAPAVALLFVMNIFPLLWSLGLSFFHYRASSIQPPTWLGLTNFANVLSSPDVWDRLRTTGLIMLLTVGCQLVVGFLLALLFEKRFAGRRVLLALVLTPMMLSYVAVGAFFRYYYEPTFGLLSQFVRIFTGEPFVLLKTPWGARAGIVFADAWMWSPFVMLLVLAGLVSVPSYLYEAAEIDRASWWRRFTTITFPYIRGLLLLALLFRTIEAFKLFDVVFLINEGGPGTSNETIALYIYRQSFEYNKTSYAVALTYIVVFVVVVLTNLYLYGVNRRATEGG